MKFAELDGLGSDNVKSQVAEGAKPVEFASDLKKLVVHNLPLFPPGRPKPVIEKNCVQLKIFD